MKFLFATILSACLLAACSSASTPRDTNADFLYGRHAGQPMRDAPDSY